ncbi:MAG: PKD domain containing protein, partial [Gemmatimonadota bacterium]|nr:PKD domain containing protein [Gemmatimonadota bacterium]
MQKCGAILTVGVLWALSAAALERPDTTFKIFQFPADQIPRVDGDVSDWGMVPADYAVGIDQLKDTVHDSPIDTTDLDVTVRVGWVKGLNRLYFLYEAYDDYWDFSHRDLHNDILEIVVDGDLSGGPLIPQLREDKETNGLEGLDGHFKFHGVHAQNYHVL